MFILGSQTHLEPPLVNGADAIRLARAWLLRGIEGNISQHREQQLNDTTQISP